MSVETTTTFEAGSYEQVENLLSGLESENHTLVLYHPILKQLTGDTNAAILLRQILFYAKLKEGQPFFKFVEPCDHPLYRIGDSWTESLSFSRDEYYSAIKKIGTYVKRQARDNVLNETHPMFGPTPDKRCRDKKVMLNSAKLVAYWRESDRVTRYAVNLALLYNAICACLTRDESDNPICEVENSTATSSIIHPPYNREIFRDFNKEETLGPNFPGGNLDAEEKQELEKPAPISKSINPSQLRGLENGRQVNTSLETRTGEDQDPPRKLRALEEWIIAMSPGSKRIAPTYVQQLESKILWHDKNINAHEGPCPLDLWDNVPQFQEFCKTILLDDIHNRNIARITPKQMTCFIASGQTYRRFYGWAKIKPDATPEPEIEETEEQYLMRMLEANKRLMGLS